MASIKCPKCGAINNSESNFCNKCGASLQRKKETLCSYCHQIIPADSVFCPSCGKMVRNDMRQPVEPMPIAFDTMENTPTPPAMPVRETYNEDEMKPAASHRARNWTIGIIAGLIVAAVASLIIYDNYFAPGDKPLSDSDTIVAQLSPDEALRVFDETIQAQNYGGDGAKSVYAISANCKGKNLLIGLRTLSDANGRSFFKIFTLQDTSGVWNVTDNISRFVDGASITADRQDLMLSFDDAPQYMAIDGKDYFYFVYLASPVNITPEAKSHLIFGLYNIETKDIITLDYAGQEVKRDTQTFVKGDFTNARNTPESQFLQQQAAKAQIIYKPTPEELAMDEPKNAAKKWVMANSAKMDEVRSTSNPVKLDVTFYDQPIFNKSSLSDSNRAENEAYIFLCDKNGAVYGFNKKARTYFVVYAPVSESSPSKLEINADETLHVIAQGVEFNYDASITEATGIQ